MVNVKPKLDCSCARTKKTKFGMSGSNCTCVIRDRGKAKILNFRKLDLAYL